MIFLLSLIYLFAGFWSALTVAMIIAPDTENNPIKAPDWVKLIIMILSGLVWPITLLVFFIWWVYTKL